MDRTSNLHFSAQDQLGHAPLRQSGPVAALLERTVDVALACVVLVAPLLMGGRHPLGELAVVVLAITAAAAWLLRQTMASEKTHWTWTSAEWLLLAGAGLLVLQLVPLGDGVYRALAPGSAAALPLWSSATGGLGFGNWHQVSFAPNATCGSLIMFLAYALLFVTAAQRLRRLEDVERLLTCLALGAVVLATVGLAQYLAGNGKFLWLYEHPYRTSAGAVKGPFINKNHFAHMLALGLGPLVWLLAQLAGGGRERRRAESRTLLPAAAALVALAVVLFAGLMALSRGGTVAMVAAAVISVAALMRAGVVGHKLALSMAGAFALMVAALAIHGYRDVSNRLDDYTSASLDELDQKSGRRNIWSADAKAARDYWCLGTGAGTHREVYPMYYTGSYDVELTHAENGYLQVLMETGVPGLALLGAGLALCATWCSQALRRSQDPRALAAAAAVAGGLAASVLHSFVDFVWYIPACMTYAVLLCACACRLAHFAAGDARRERACSPSWCGAALACVMLVGGWMSWNCFCRAMASPHWDRYLASTLVPPSESQDDAAENEVFRHVDEVLRWTPSDARAHIRMASLCLRRFDQLQKHSANAMALSQVRDAALASGFTSRQQLDDWLNRAVGSGRSYLDKALWHVRRGLALCPLQGEGYLYLTELCFLEGARPEAKSALVAQALSVRPNSPRVLLAAGNEAALAGRLDEAVALWKRAFHGGASERSKLIALLVGNRVPPEFALTHFDPDLSGLRSLYAEYASVGPVEPLGVLADRYTAALQHAAREDSGEGSAALWMEARAVYVRQKQESQAAACLCAALEADPACYDAHLLLGTYLEEQGRMADAARHLEWCRARRPGDAVLNARYETLVRTRVER